MSGRSIESAAMDGTPNGLRSASDWDRLGEIEDRIFTEGRLRFYSFGVIASYLLALIWSLYKGQFLIGDDGRPTCIDFSWMWISGKLAASSAPVDAYDYNIFSSLRVALVGPASCILDHFDYPPTFMLFTYPLSFLPYLIAFAVWIAVTLLLYGTTIHSIIPRPVTVMAAVTPFAVLVNIQYGHNGFVTASLIGLSLALMERRPCVSGILLGLLTFKPQFGILFPIALLASRDWCVFFSAVGAVAAISLTAALFFGYEGWPLFFHTLIQRDSNLMLDDRLIMVFQSPFGLLRWAGASASVSWAGHLAVVIVVLLAVCAIWARPVPHALKAAALCVGSVMVTPYVLPWDLCILSVAVAFLVRDGLQRGFLAGERLVMLVCWAGLFKPVTPIAPIICAALLSLVVRRIIACHRLRQVPLLSGGHLSESKVIVAD